MLVVLIRETMTRVRERERRAELLAPPLEPEDVGPLTSGTTEQPEESL